MFSFQVNGQPVEVDAPPDTPLLWVIRDYLQLKGSKFGCGMGLCGACTMHINGHPIRSCIFPLRAAEGQQVTTIEGLGTPEQPHLLQRLWTKNSVSQCGYCQPGQVMSAAALLANNPAPSSDYIDLAMSGNICRCGSYPRIKATILEAAQQLNAGVSYYQPEASRDEP